MQSLKTTIANIELESCLMNASGCWCSTLYQLNELFNAKTGLIVSKSGTLLSRSGNIEPRLFIDDYGSINSMGLPNLGYNFYTDYGANVNKPFMQSLYPFSFDELDIMVKYIDNKIKKPQLIELNISCPNLTDHRNSEFNIFESYMDKINQLEYDNLIIGLKLSPLFELQHYDIMSNLLLKYNIPFITCVNSLPNGLMVNVETETTRIIPNNGCGGISGTYIKPIALSNVYNYSKRLDNKIDIIGCGGITSGKDAFEHILCGAKAVQIGTTLIQTGISCFDRIDNELRNIMFNKQYCSINDFYKKIKN